LYKEAGREANASAHISALRLHCIALLISAKFKFKVTNGVNVDSASSQRKHNKTVQSTKSTEISLPDRTKPDVAQVTHHGSCMEGDKSAVPVSATTKAKVVSSFKLTVAGQVI